MADSAGISSCKGVKNGGYNPYIYKERNAGNEINYVNPHAPNPALAYMNANAKNETSLLGKIAYMNAANNDESKKLNIIA